MYGPRTIGSFLRCGLAAALLAAAAPAAASDTAIHEKEEVLIASLMEAGMDPTVAATAVRYDPVEAARLLRVGLHPFVRGDVNADESVDIGDAVRVIHHLFAGEPLGCARAGDANRDGTVDISDPVALLNFLFLGTYQIRDPYPECGIDLGSGSLECKVSDCFGSTFLAACWDSAADELEAIRHSGGPDLQIALLDWAYSTVRCLRIAVETYPH